MSLISRVLGSKRRKLILAAGTVGGMIVAGVAVAFFTGGAGSGTGNATVGASSALAVTVNSAGATGAPIYPGAGTEKIPFTVTNNSSGHQGLTSLTYAIANDGSGNVVTGVNNTPVSGCLASWFSASGDSGNPALPDDLAGSGTYTGDVDVTMSDVNSSQDACQNVTPNVTVTAN
jgi:hypothetical protein